MCGIAGVLNLNGEDVSHNIIKEMTDIIAHRGPDDQGQYVAGQIGLGNRRLAILDLSEAGHQPMSDTTGKLWLTYNGEIYNFRELRAELEDLGFKFRSNTDSEVILNAYEAWGKDSVQRLNGMFAFAIWNAERRELFLARDRYGVKPLHYFLDDEKLMFASEIKSFTCHPEFSVKVNEFALLEYFTFQNIFTDGSFFKGVKLLPAGNTAVLSLNNPDKLVIEQYWDFEFRNPDLPKDVHEYAEELDRLFSQAVKRQLISDVPVGAYLSGGMDSGAITAVAASQIPNLTSFTAGFDLSSASGLEISFDERQRAEELSYRFKTEHYQVVLKAGDMERVLPELVWHLEDPRVGQSYPNYYVARLASKFVKVVLAGTGGDELFAGYPWRYYRAVSNSNFDEYVEKYYVYWQRLVSNTIIHKLFQPAVWELIKDTLTIDIFRDVLSESNPSVNTPEDYVNHSLYFEIKTFMHGLLVVEDKLSMAHGLETRVPFLDNDLVDFAVNVPVQHKLRDLDDVVWMDENQPGPKFKKYHEATNDGKIILRKVLARYMPNEYVQGIKQGFSAPDASWFRGDSIDYVRELLMDDQARIYKFLRQDTVQGLVNEHLRGERNRRLLIWSLLNFEWWLRKFM
jgi:asparagine synthase (glutamine-hydrolysing)